MGKFLEALGVDISNPLGLTTDDKESKLESELPQSNPDVQGQEKPKEDHFLSYIENYILKYIEKSLTATAALGERLYQCFLPQSIFQLMGQPGDKEYNKAIEFFKKRK